MAKSDTTTTPKRVATTRPENRRGMTKTQIREERRQRSNARKKRRRTLYVIGGGVLGLFFILAMTIGTFGGLANRNRAGEGGNINEGGPVPIDPDIGRDHILPSQAGGGYSQRPATSGPHWFEPNVLTLADGTKVDAPADWDTHYKYPLPDEVLVHNLEHGGIGIHYDCPEGCPDIVQQLEDLRPGNGWYIMSPYSGITDGHKIAITAWRHHLFLDTVDAAKIQEFIDAYQDHAPESLRSNSWN